jgi:hypothetical protein
MRRDCSDHVLYVHVPGTRACSFETTNAIKRLSVSAKAARVLDEDSGRFLFVLKRIDGGEHNE